MVVVVDEAYLEFVRMEDAIDGIATYRRHENVVLTRTFLVDEPKLVVVAYPSRGLDIASVRATQQLLLERRAAGAGILMVSEDLDELLLMADRILVLHDGHVAGIVDPAKTDRQAIGRLMLQGAAA